MDKLSEEITRQLWREAMEEVHQIGLLIEGMALYDHNDTSKKKCEAFKRLDTLRRTLQDLKEWK